MLNFLCGAGVWHIKGCSEIHTGGWYQPMVLNKAALSRLQGVSASYGLTDVCRAFDVTHDVGMGVLAWILDLFHMKIPAANANNKRQGIGSVGATDLAVHCIRHDEDEDHCSDGANWGPFRYNQTLAIGCGDLGISVPSHDPVKYLADMYDVWDFFLHLLRDKKNVLIGVDGQQDWAARTVILEETDLDLDCRSMMQHGVANASSCITTNLNASDDRVSISSRDAAFTNSSNNSTDHRNNSSAIIKSATLPTNRVSHILVGKPEPNLEPGSVWDTVAGVKYTYQPFHRHEVRVVPNLELLTGYKQTVHSQTHDILKVWHTFTLEDCLPPGVIKS